MMKRRSRHALHFLPLLTLVLCSYGQEVEGLTEIIKDDHLEGPNVCKEIENYTVTITTPKEEAYQERYQKWCVGIPPRCSAYRIRVRTVNETKTLIKQRIVKKCCVGYTLSDDQNHCVPECKAGCQYGSCIEPNVCLCDQGFAGKSCSIKCPPKRWGSDCSQHCKCTNNSVCNAADGSCTCQRGFQGRYCEETCNSDRFGQDCAEICQCQNGGKCDHVSGECYCPAGYTGPLCTDLCPPGTHGAQCQSKCRCQNGGKCDPVNGECICPPGYTGTVCANRCQPGLYGLNCTKRCECFNGADCDRATGQCICAPGFMGAKCLDSCPNSLYGINCTETCRCQNQAPCDPADGRCSCPDGWTGADCGQRICRTDRFGANCTGICECDWDNTKMCHPWTGKCQCQPGWSNSACDRPCRFLRYGQDCQLTCNCKNSSPCSHIDGTCLCIAGFRGESCEEPCSNNTYGQNCSERCQCMNGATCEGDSGKCVCAPGWQGIKCDRPCDALHFGRDCTEECRCQNGGACNPINGQCTCPAGWTGPLCDQKCTSGRFGQNCEQVCDCHLDNIIACNATTGRCICKADWGGVRCESRCALGFYGEKCNEICTCHNNSSCDPTTGECICSPGWTGASCSEPCPKGFFGHGCKQRCPGSTEPNRTCNPITGQYSCPPGYVGPTCEHPCSSGLYGQDCQKRCSCRNGGECSHVTGQCQCPPGWTGPHCETVCEDMYYGTNCSQRCNCRNNAKCRKNDGNCICEAGWMGHRCDEVCPDGFYGNHCMNACECPVGNFVCHAAKGCVCMVGYTGKNCDVPMRNELVQVRADEEASDGGGSEQPGVDGPRQQRTDGQVFNISIVVLNASIAHEQNRDHIVVSGENEEGSSSPVTKNAPYNVTLWFPLYANSYLPDYNRTHPLKPGQQLTLRYRANGFLDLTLVQMHSYVTVGVGGSTEHSNFMETFINSTRYRVEPQEGTSSIPVTVDFVNLQPGSRGNGSGNRTIALQKGQKIVIRLVEFNASRRADHHDERDGLEERTIGEVAHNSTRSLEDAPENVTDKALRHKSSEVNATKSDHSNVDLKTSTAGYTTSGPVHEDGDGNAGYIPETTYQDESTKTDIPVEEYSTSSIQSDETDQRSPSEDGITQNYFVDRDVPFGRESTTEGLVNQQPLDSSLVLSTEENDAESLNPSPDTPKNAFLSTIPSPADKELPFNLSDTEDVPPDILLLDEFLSDTFLPLPPRPTEGKTPQKDLTDNETESNTGGGIASKRIDDSTEVLLSGASGAGTVWAIMLTILFGCVVTAILLYYRRRVANLKAEVNHVVNYMTQEQPSHFDNPVYARSGGGAAAGTANGSLSRSAMNGGTVPPLDSRIGLLRNVLPNNLRKPSHDKYSYPDNEYGTDKSYSISHYGPESLKNFEADMTNPNLFKDHVYDEIRLKDSIAALTGEYAYVYTEYDHLDYSRPGGSHKAHYFRMTDDGNSYATLPAGAGGPSPVPNGNLNRLQNVAAAAAGPSGGGGSPKAINVLRDQNGPGGPINNLSAPRTLNLTSGVQAGVPPADDADARFGNDLSSSSNSSPTPPSSPPSSSSLGQHLLRHGHDHPSVVAARLVPDSSINEMADDEEQQQLYMAMSAGEAVAAGGAAGGNPSTSSSTSASDFGGVKIPNHQLNIKE